MVEALGIVPGDTAIAAAKKQVGGDPGGPRLPKTDKLEVLADRVNCDECGELLPEDAETCPSCGAEVPE